MKMIDHVCAATVEYIDHMPKDKRKKYGQFFTSKETAVFMAGLFSIPEGRTSLSILDPGAGSGILSVALLERLESNAEIDSIELVCYENDANIVDLLYSNLEWACSHITKDALSKCIAFVDDLHKWVSYCDNLKNYILVEEAQTECINSIYMCAQGFYKEAMTTLRQFFEHMLFAILLSTNDYKYRLWQVGKYDMSWSQIVDDQNGIFGKQFISVYAENLDEVRSVELITIAKNVYRECSEYVHGNFEKLSSLPDNLLFDESAIDQYMDYFSSAQYLICMALFIRFRHIFNEHETIAALESIITDNLGTLSEIQQPLFLGS